MPKIKNQSLDAVIANIEKQMGDKGVIVRYGDSTKKTYKTLSFGYPEVDEASNCGGIARGKVIEIYGPESGGKSFLSLKLIGSAQKENLPCCLVDAEQSFVPEWAKKHGVDVENLYVISESMSAEKTLDYIDKICKSGAFGLIVVDSTAALIPQKELEGSIGDQDYALLARAMSKGVKKIVAACGATGTTCVFINQIREKMGVIFGNPETTPGGRALRFYAHQRIMVLPGKTIKIKDGKREKVIARRSLVKFIKNKTAAPFGECYIEIIFFEDAASPMVKVCNLAKDCGLIGIRNNLFQIKKDVVGEKKNVDTGAATIVQLADYVVKNNLVPTLIAAYKKAIEESSGKVDKIIDEIEKNPVLIVSPLEGKTITVEDAENDDKLVVDISSTKEDTEEDMGDIEK